MRSRIPGLLFLTALAAAPAVAEDLSLDQVIDRYVEARGGMENLQGLRSLRMTGTMMVGPGQEAPFQITWVRPRRMRMELEVQGVQGIRALNGDEGWQVMPFAGIDSPQAMSGTELSQLVELAESMEGPLVHWKAKGHQVELVGKSDLEGAEVYHLRVTRKSGKASEHFLDTESFHEVASHATLVVQGTEIEAVTTYGDFRQVAGMTFPHRRESKPRGAPAGQTITFETVEVNGTIDPSTFEMPAPE